MRRRHWPIDRVFAGLAPGCECHVSHAFRVFTNLPNRIRTGIDGGDCSHRLHARVAGATSRRIAHQVIALFTLSNSSDSFLILRAVDAGIPIGVVPLLWAAHHGTKVLSSLYGGDLSDRLGRKRLIVSGWVLYAAVYAGFAFATQSISLWILFLIYGIYFGLVEGAEKALVADLVRPEQRGTAYGLYNLAFGVTVFPASLLMGMIWAGTGPTTAVLASALLGATAAVLLLILVRPHPEPTETRA